MQEKYNQFINQLRSRPTPEGYVETHHIIPKSHGGSNEPDNLIILTYAEHVEAHFYLAHIYMTNGMLWAFNGMVMQPKYQSLPDDLKLFNFEELQYLKEQWIIKHSEHMKSEEVRNQKRLTCQEKYGVDNPMQSKKVKRQIRQTNFWRRGVNHVFQCPSVKERIMETRRHKFPERTIIHKIHGEITARMPIEFTQILVEKFNIVFGVSTVSALLRGEKRQAHGWRVKSHLTDASHWPTVFEQVVETKRRNTPERTVVHEIYGEVTSRLATDFKQEFLEKFGIKVTRIAYVLNGDLKQSKGWRLKTTAKKAAILADSDFTHE